MVTFVWPALEMEMLPPHMHVSLDESLSAFSFLTFTVAQPGLHGEVVLGTQGAAVGVPKAAAVAAITAGFALALHITKVGTFTIGLWSMVVAAGWLQTLTFFTGSTVSTAGPVPMEHDI